MCIGEGDVTEEEANEDADSELEEEEANEFKKKVPLFESLTCRVLQRLNPSLDREDNQVI